MTSSTTVAETMRARATLLAVLLVSAAPACTPATRYYWGDYERVIYQMYRKPGEADPKTQIIRLTEDLDRAEEQGKPIPPGVCIHLGYMYSLVGRNDKALQYLEMEKRRYPESRPFVNRLVANMNRSFGSSSGPAGSKLTDEKAP